MKIDPSKFRDPRPTRTGRYIVRWFAHGDKWPFALNVVEAPDEESAFDISHMLNEQVIDVVHRKHGPVSLSIVEAGPNL